MYKQAGKFGVTDALTLMNPFASVMNTNPTTPMKIAENPIVNRALWNALFAGGALLTAGAGIKYLTSHNQDEHFAKKHKEAIDAKLNGIVPVTEPDSDLGDTKEREKRRKKEIPVTKKATEDDGVLLGGTVKNALLSALPIAAAGGALFAGSQLVDKAKKEDREATLKREVAQLQNKLDSLYSQRLALSEQRRALKKQASVAELLQGLKTRIFGSDDPESARRSDITATFELPFVSAALASALAGYAGYKYFSKHDKDRAKVKMLEERILPTDLVGTPPTIVMELGKDGKVRVPGRGKVSEEPRALPAAPPPATSMSTDRTLQALGLNL